MEAKKSIEAKKGVEVEKNAETKKGVEVEKNTETKKNVKKDKNPYDARIDSLQREFSLSDLEVDGMKKFLGNPAFNKKKATIRDVLDTIIETDKLNVRQKIALSYSIGMFQVERNVVRVPMIPDMIPDMPRSGG